MSFWKPQFMPRRWHIRPQIISAVLFALIPLLFIAGVSVFQLAVNVPDERIARANTLSRVRLIRAADALDEAIQDAERGQRGFLITGGESYLEPYNNAKERIPQLMIDLQREIGDASNLHTRVLHLQSEITTKMNELAATIDAMRQNGFDAAKAIVQSDVGRKTMQAIEDDLREIIDVAQQRLNVRLADAEAADRRVTWTFVVGSVVSALALLAGAYMLARAYRRAATSEQVLQTTLDSVREGVVAFDEDERLHAWNDKFAAMLGPDAGKVRRGTPLTEVASGKSEVTERIRELDAIVEQTGLPGLIEREGEEGSAIEIFHNRTVDGGHVTTFLDVTERRRAEKALRQSQSLEALGHMTGGVAHDFNNLLTVVIGSLDFLRRAVGHDMRARERLDAVAVATERGARMTKQLLAFARRQTLEPEIVNLDRSMQEILSLIRRAVGESVTVEYVCAGGLWNTIVDTAQFQSAILNLAINARDAMPDGGKLTIELANAFLDDRYAARIAEVEPGQYVLFAMTDMGCGMDAATLQRALDPFFTTKPVGEGTGLGLPQVYGFVKQSGGHMKIYSEVGEGTTIKIYLPRGLGQENVRVPRREVASLTGSETVLLVDDNEIVRATVAEMLDDLGYQVLVAGSGTEALAILKDGSKVDLLFTDVIMPGELGGRGLAEEAMKILPCLKVLFTSGYTENAIVHNGRLDPNLELLSKPYDREQLAMKIRRVLDQPPKEGA
jgi:signal transduction histidine kinase/CHASE3 domain sensor protein/ActR/RegA family two-component response regulator